MNARRVSAMYFSATGTTKRIVLAVAGRIARAWGEELRLEDFTLPQGREKPRCFEEGDLVVFGRPRSMPGGSRTCSSVTYAVSQAEAPWPSPWCATETGIMTTRSSNCATCWRRLASGPSRQGHLWASTRSPASSGAGRPDAEDIAKGRGVRRTHPPAARAARGGQTAGRSKWLQPLQALLRPQGQERSARQHPQGQAESRRGLYELRALRPAVSHWLDSPGERGGIPRHLHKMRRLRQGLPGRRQVLRQL